MCAMNLLSKLGLIGIVSFSVCGYAGITPSAEAVDQKTVAAYRTALLDQAYDIASAMPLDPHIKDRSRAQEKVLQAALELDQPSRALRYAEGIANWRRGKGYADYACYMAGHGVTNDMPVLLKKADSIARAAKQEWRRDAVLQRIEQANALSKPQPSEQPPATFEEKFSEIDAVVLKGNLDDATALVQSCLRLYGEYYTNEAHRNQLRQKIEESWNGLPVFLRLNAFQEMATVALDHQDLGTALQMADDAVAMMAGNTWPVEYSIPQIARFASIRDQAGEPTAAFNDLQKALQTFREQQSEIVDIDRAEALVPLAEAALAMNDPDTARAVYNAALDAAVLNANSRPRATDLSMICVSMAVTGFEPDEALLVKLDRLQEELGDPW